MMQLSFMDTNNLFSNLVQQSEPFTGQTGFENSKTHLFANTLQQMLSQAQSTQEMGGMNLLDEKAILEQAKKMFLNEAVPEQGMPFLSKLQAIFLQMSGGNLKHISLDAQGLDALKTILLKAGFEPTDVEGVITSLTERAQAKELSLQEVMDHLFELSPGDETQPASDEIILETSALPFMIAILSSLGLSHEMTRDIISQADRGQQGISLDVIITQLKAIEVQSFYTGQPYKTQGQDSSFEKLFAQLGLGVPGDDPLIDPAGRLNAKPDPSTPVLSENRSAGISLSHFLRALETLRENLMEVQGPARVSSGIDQGLPIDTGARESSLSAIEGLLKSMNLKPARSEVPSFSYTQIKDQFENDLLIPGKQAPHKNGLFSQNQPVSDLKSEPMLREIGTILSQKSGPLADSRSRFKEGEEGVKGFKPEAARGGELAGRTLEFKPEGSLADVKTKSVFQNLPAHVTLQVGKSLVRAINQGENSLKIQLKPTELGRLVMTIDNVGNSMKVSITTENPVVKDILISHMNELKTVLANAGISLEKFDVDLNSDFRQSYADARNPSDNSSRKGSNSEQSLFDAIHTETMNDPAGGLTASTQNGSYHFVA